MLGSYAYRPCFCGWDMGSPVSARDSQSWLRSWEGSGGSPTLPPETPSSLPVAAALCRLVFKGV